MNTKITNDPFLPFRALAVILAVFGPAQFVLADNELWVGNPGVTTTTNWSDTANWSGASANPNNNTVYFGNNTAVGSGVINNVVDRSTNCYALNYTNTTSYNNTLILPGQTLTIDGNNGGDALVMIPAGQFSTTNTISGSGTLLITGASAGGVAVTVTNSSVGGVAPTLDMSGLGTFIISNADSTAALLVGAPATPRAGGILELAMTNYLSLPATGTGATAAIVLGYNNGNNGSTPGGEMFLGRLNQIFADNISVGLSKQSAATFAFNPAFTNNNPVATINGYSGTAVKNWAIGDGINTSGGSTGPGGTVNFNGGTVNAAVNAMWLGKPSQTSTGTPTGTGTFSFSAGVVSVNLLTNSCALTPTTGGPGKAAGTINVNGTATLVVNTNLVLGYMSSGSASSTGILNINGGTVAANVITAGGGTNIIYITNGTLVVTNTAGTAAAPLTTLALDNSTLDFPIMNGTPNVVVGTLAISGSADVINVPTLPAISSFSAQFTVIKYGTLTGAFDFTLGTLPVTFEGYLSNNIANSSVDLVITNSTLKSDTWNGNVSGNWDTGALNWVSGGNPASYLQGDDVTFDDTLTGTPDVILTTDLTPSSMTVNNSAKNYVFSGNGELTGVTGLSKNSTGSLTMAETGGDTFSGGVAVNGGTLVLDNANSAITGGLTINSGATVQIGNNDENGVLPAGSLNNGGTLTFSRSDNVSISTVISGGGALIQNGSGTVTLSAANNYTGNTFVLQGTLALTGAGSISSSGQVSVSGATLDVSGVTGLIALNNLNLTNANLNESLGLTVNSLNLGGSANTINVITLPPIENYPATLTLLRTTGGLSGYNFVLGSLPASGTAYLGSIAESPDKTSVLLTLTAGPVGVRPSVVWTGADALNNVSTNWSDAQNWQTPGAPTPLDNIVFNDVAAAGSSALSSVGGGPNALVGNINNLVDTNFTIATLTYTNVDNDYQNTLISAGRTLSVINSTNSNSLIVGSGSADFGANAAEYVTIAGAGGTLNMDNTNGTTFVGLGSASSGSHQATLDLSALDTFQATMSRFLVGVGSSSEGINESAENGVAYLARTNIITAAATVIDPETSDTGASAMAVDIGDADGGGGSVVDYIYLGQTNAIFADAIGIGRQKSTAGLLFNPVWANNGVIPSVYFRGRDGVSALGTWSLGDGVVNSGTATCTGVALFTGGDINALVDNLYVGSAANNTSGSGTATGLLIFGNGIINAQTAYIGYQPANSSKVGLGTVDINNDNNENNDTGGTLAVGTLNLGVTGGGSGAANTAGTININNGTLQAGTIVAGTNGGTGTINLNGGALIITGTAGTPGAPLTTLNLSGGTLQLNLNGVSSTNIVANSISISGTTLNIGSIANVFSPTTIPLISYTGGDPFGGLTLGTLPAGYAGYLVDDNTADIISLTLTSVTPPVSYLAINNLSLSGANLTVTGTNQGTGAYYVLTSTNLTLPLKQWTPVATNVLSGSGSFTLTATNAVFANMPQQFYILSTTNN